MDPLYLTQVAFACLLAFLGCLGNTTACIAIKLSPVPKCPYFINLMLLDLVAILFGPGAYLVVVVFDPSWLREETSACIVAKGLQKYSLIGSLLSLAFLAWSHCRKKELPQKKIVLVFSILSTWFLPAIILLCAFLIQKSHFLDIPWFMYYSSTTSSLQGFSSLGIVIVIIAASVHSFSLWLAFSSIMSKNTYYMQEQWKRHTREITVNDPECSTFHMSMSYSESTSVSLDKIFNTFPGKKTSIGQISFHNANRNWTINHQPDYPKSGEGKTEKVSKTNSDSNEVFYDNDKGETSNVSLEDGAGNKRHRTKYDSVFTEACISSSEQSFAYKSSVESMKSASSTDESSSKESCYVEHAVAPSATSACKDTSSETDTMSTTSKATQIIANFPVKNSTRTATADIHVPNTHSHVKHPETPHFPSVSSVSASPTKNGITSLSPFGHIPTSAGNYNVNSFYSPVLNASPWYYSTSPCSPYPAILGSGAIRKYKKAKFISPITIDFAKTDRTVKEFNKLVLVVTCLSTIGWLLFSAVFILSTVGLVLPEEVMRLSTMALFFKSAMTPVLYGVCFSRHRLACKKYINSRLSLSREAEKCSSNLNDAAVIGAHLAQDECGVQLERYSRCKDGLEL